MVEKTKILWQTRDERYIIQEIPNFVSVVLASIDADM